MEQISVLSQEFNVLKVKTSSSYSREVEDLRKQIITSNSLIAALEKRVNEQFLLKSSEIRAVAVSVTALSDEIKQLIQFEEDSIREEIKRSFELNLEDVTD
jgi:archaellum component FlaC